MPRHRVPCLIAILVFGVGCSPAIHHAAFTEPRTGTSITITLEQAHPYLAEYRRWLIVDKREARLNRYKLAMDTGGYAAANLHACGDGALMIASYSQDLLVDLATGTVTSDMCAVEAEYLGVFDGGGRQPWQFFTASQRPHRPLVMRGG